MMPAVLRLGPADEGRTLTYKEFCAAHYREGYRYELIEGRLTIAPFHSVRHDVYATTIFSRLVKYARGHRDFAGYVSGRSRVFVHLSDPTTAPEPDVAMFREMPSGPLSHDWPDLTPIVVVEILEGAGAEKDLVRNVDLYACIPSILEYWVFDLREDRVKLKVFRRASSREAWNEFEFLSDDVYTTPLLPGFTMPVAVRW